MDGRSADAAAGSGQAVSVRWLARGLGRVLLVALIVVSGPVLVAIAFAVDTGNILYDFKGGLWNAGVAILHGVSPYQPVFLAHQAAIMRAGHIALGETARHPFSVPVYPAFANVLVVPLSLLGLVPAGVIYTLASVAAMLGGMWLLGVRDRRCLALALVSWPFLYGTYLGAIGPFMVLGAGVAWRWRARLWPPAVAIASIVAIKIFPWTLGVWLLLTRRLRAFALCAAVGVALTFGAWALIGFHGLAQYPQMLSNMSFLQEGRAESLVTGLLVAGVAPGPASVLAIAVALAVLGIAWRVSGGPDGDRRSFGLAVLAALASTPIVWEHYMVLLFVPIALCSPRLSRLWLIPVLTPAVIVFSQLPFPVSSRVQAYSPNAMRGVLCWLAAELIIGVALTTTAAQRARWRAFARGWVAPRRRPAAAAASSR